MHQFPDTILLVWQNSKLHSHHLKASVSTEKERVLIYMSMAKKLNSTLSLTLTPTVLSVGAEVYLYCTTHRDYLPRKLLLIDDHI